MSLILSSTIKEKSKEESFNRFVAKSQMLVDGELMPIPLMTVINDPAHAFKELGFEVKQVKGQVRSRIHYSFRRLPPRGLCLLPGAHHGAGSTYC